MESKSPLSKAALSKTVLRGLLGSLAMFGLLFVGAGRLDYWQAWVYLASGILIMGLMGTVLTKDRSLIEERLNPRERMKGWDRFYFGVTTPLYVIALLIAGLDARFG